ncbi:FmdE family protein [Salidesulfovibrio onnuriiensis]|uniref:FmdE family protein n=1 Tax=Salidesulfovibrio onnuriiensis TaxID=2583823 RepID=UPI0011C90F5C|nr:FmdE family protein [Salidesulfovibrio onnuriiensis]
MSTLETATPPQVTADNFSFDQFLELATWFHNYPAPGLLLGGYMVEEAKRHIPEGTLFEAISETSWCLPDAIQLLTPCTTGNGWMRVLDLGVYALSLYDKFTGKGVRVSLDPEKVKQWGEAYTWLMKFKPKPEQDSKLLRAQIRDFGPQMLTVEEVQLKPRHTTKRHKGEITLCPICGDAYPAKFGSICRSCAGDSPYLEKSGEPHSPPPAMPKLRSLSAEEIVGRAVLHDMTRIEPGKSKGPEFTRGHIVTPGDVCRLQQMGRFQVYVDQPAPEGFIHEDDAAEAFALALCGPGVKPGGSPREGRVNLVAERDGLLVIREPVLEGFNSLPLIMAAGRRNHSVVREGRRVAATRAIPLFLDQNVFNRAMSLLEGNPAFEVRALRKANVGLLITGDEVFKGLIEDKFAAVIESKARQYDCTVGETIIAPDNADRIAEAAARLMDAGCDLIITTAGLSVDPGDVTRAGLEKAGVTDMLHGMPVLPGAMTLIARLGHARVLGVPACALFHKTTSLDILLPRLLADLPVTRADLAKLGNGGMCMECSVCTYPKCPFGR